MEIHIRRPGAGGFGPWWLVLIPGGLCVLIGILIIYVPDLLETMVASAFILIGIVLLSAGWRLRPPRA